MALNSRSVPSRSQRQDRQSTSDVAFDKDRAMREVQEEGRKLKSWNGAYRCQSVLVTTSAGSTGATRCRKFCDPLKTQRGLSYKTLGGKKRPPYTLAEACSLLSIMLCRYHLYNERHCVRLLVELMQLSDQEAGSEIAAELFPQGTRLNEIVRKRIARALGPCPLLSSMERTPDLNGINAVMDWLPAVLALVLSSGVRQCIGFAQSSSTSKRCTKTVDIHDWKSAENVLSEGQDSDALTPQNLQDMADGMFCRPGHWCHEWVRAYERKWWRELEEVSSEISSRDMSLPVRTRQSQRRDQSSDIHQNEGSETGEGDTDDAESHISKLDFIEHGHADEEGDESTEEESGELFQFEPVRISLPNATLSPTTLDIIRDLQQIATCEGIIPGSVREKAKRQISKGTLQDIEERHFADNYTPLGKTERLEWEKASEIYDKAMWAYDAQHAEPGWNEIQADVLYAAFSRWKGKDSKSTRVKYCNITKATVADDCRDTLSAIFSDKSRMVDYAVTVQYEESMRDEIEILLQEEVLQEGGRAAHNTRKHRRTSVNYACQEAVRLTPIAINIETKPALGDDKEAYKQLEYCVSAHFIRLQRLTRVSAARRRPASYRMPELPLILVRGHDWKLMIAYIYRKRLRVLPGMPIGTTETLVGIYQLIASLRRLGVWVDEVYRPWFTQAVLQVAN